MQPVPGTRPACAGTEAGRFKVPYLALHPMGFSVPRRLRVARWALTPPFHPYSWEISNLGFETRPGRYVLCGTLRRRSLAASPPACIPAEQAWVTRHRALWCSDFPPPRRLRNTRAILRPSRTGHSIHGDHLSHKQRTGNRRPVAISNRPCLSPTPPPPCPCRARSRGPVRSWCR